MRKCFRILICLCVCVASLCHGRAGAVTSPVDDGFRASKRLESHYFSVSLADGVEEGRLMQKLNIGPGHKILAGQRLQGESFSPTSLMDLVDALFVWSCGVLDMDLYNYRGNIKIAKEPGQLKEIYLKLYGVQGRDTKAFYIYEVNTLYITEEDFTKEILGHEMAHAIISNFFVVQPPQKVAEVLAGYIEFQLRKMSSAYH